MIYYPLARSSDGVSYCFESFSFGATAGAFDFVLAFKTCFYSVSLEELEVPSFGSVVSGVNADVIVANEFYKTNSEIFCQESYEISQQTFVLLKMS